MPSLEQIRRLSYQATSDGMDKLAQDLNAVDAAQARVATGSTALAEGQGKVVQATGATIAVTEKQSTTTLRAGATLDKLLKQIDEQYLAERRVAAGRAILDNSMRQGLLTQQEYGTHLEQLVGKYSAFNDNLAHSTTAQGMNRMQMMESVHVVKSLADSIIAGQDPLRAFAVEGGRIGQIFSMGEGGVGAQIKGMGLAVYGVVGPLGLAAAGVAALGTGAYFYATAMRDTTKIIEEHAAALSSLKSAYDLAAKGETSFGVEAANVHKVILRANVAELEEGYRLQSEDIRRNISFAGTKSAATTPTGLAAGLAWTPPSNVGGLINMPTVPTQTTGMYTSFRSVIDDYIRSVDAGTPKVRSFREEIARIADAHANDTAIQRQAKALLDMSAAAEKSESALGKDRDALKGVVDAARDGTGTIVAFVEAMSKLGGGIPEYLAPGLSATARFEDRLRQIDEEQRRAMQASAGQPPAMIAEIERRAELQRQAARDESSAAQWRSILERQLKPGVPKYAADNINDDFGKKLAEVMEATRARGAQLPVINRGFATSADQIAEYRRDPSHAARPGSSLHEKGEAVDLGISQIDERSRNIWIEEAARRGLVQSVHGEPWHFTDQKTSLNEENAASMRSFGQSEAWGKNVIDFEKATAALKAQGTTAGLTADKLVEMKARLDLVAIAEKTFNVTGFDRLPTSIQATIDKEVQLRAEAERTMLSQQRSQKALQEAQNFFASSLTDSFTGLIEGSSTVEQSLNSITHALLQATIQATLLGSGPLAGMLGTQSPVSGQTGGLFGSLFSGFSGFHADGGTIGAGKWGIVGEAGPEIAAGPATITPFAKIPTAAGSANTSVYSPTVAINYTGGSSGDPAADKAHADQMARSAKAMLDVHAAEFARQQMRPGGLFDRKALNV